MSQIQSIVSFHYYPSKPTIISYYQPHLPLYPLRSLKYTATKLKKTKRDVTLLLVEAASSSSSSSSSGSVSVSVSGSIQKSDESEPLISGSEVVRKFYDGINRHDLGAVYDLIAQDCVYEDLIFPTPFLGRQSILDFFGKFTDYVSTDLQFVIDAISGEDSSAVGVTWHLEWKGKAFPFSKGCSFYQLTILNGTRQIIYARDSVEPAIKPGESALVAIRGVTWLLQRFPNLADKF